MLPLRLYSTIKCRFVEMSGDVVSEEASTMYSVGEVVELVLESERFGLGSSHVQTHAPGRARAGSCRLVTSHKIQGLGFSEGIWRLEELCKAGGKLSIALKVFVSNRVFSPMWGFPPAASPCQQPSAGQTPSPKGLRAGCLNKIISSRLKINCSIFPGCWGPQVSSACAHSLVPAEAATLQSLPRRWVLGSYFWRIQR